VSTAQTHFAIDGARATFTVTRPEARNAMTWPMYDALLAACDAVDADPAVRVLVIRGAGGRSFMSGTDISQFQGFAAPEDGLGYERRLEAVIDRVERVRATTVAAVDGAATGGGMLIALACDLRVCTPSARFGIPVARTLGNCLSGANALRLMDALGPLLLKDLVMTARLIGAAEAQAHGLVSRLVDEAAFDDALRGFCDELTALAPLTLQVTKEAVRRLQALRRVPAGADDDLIVRCYASADFREGVAAFVARRPPVFEGV
jgi:enoyl-CoA hydratase/carnithine racemase